MNYKPLIFNQNYYKKRLLKKLTDLKKWGQKYKL